MLNEKILLAHARDMLFACVKLGAEALVIRPDGDGYQAMIQTRAGLFDHYFKVLRSHEADGIALVMQNLADARSGNMLIKQGRYRLEDDDIGTAWSVEIISIPPLALGDLKGQRSTLMLFFEQRSDSKS